MRIFFTKKITPISVNLKVAMRYPYVFKEQKMEFIVNLVTSPAKPASYHLTSYRMPLKKSFLRIN